MSETLKLFQLCCGHIKLLIKKLYGYTNIHIKSFLYLETAEGVNNHLKVEYMIFKEDGSVLRKYMFNSIKLKDNFVPEAIFETYSSKTK